jgi:hypothetical protein
VNRVPIYFYLAIHTRNYNCFSFKNRCLSLYRALTKLPTFETLEINGNELSERAVEVLKRELSAAGKILGGRYLQLCMIFPYYCTLPIDLVYSCCLCSDLEENDDDAEDDIESLVDGEGGESDGDEDLIKGLKNAKI